MGMCWNMSIALYGLISCNSTSDNKALSIKEPGN